MNRVFYYELKRLIFSRTFIGLFIVNGVFAWYLLTSDIIAGVACTAPFSAWSFGAYLGKVMPICILAVLFLLSCYYSKKQKSVETLMAQTPVSPGQFLAIRSAALLVCFLLICILVTGLALFFYIRFFGFCQFLDFLLPAILLLPSCFIFAVGIGLLAGRVHQSLLYLVMLIFFALGFSGVGGDFDYFGTGYFVNKPLSLPVDAFGEPAFHVSMAFGIARLLYFVAGIALFMISVSLSGKKARKA